MIDDHAGVRRAIRMALASDHVIVEADDGLTGLLRATASRPDAVLIDMDLPGMVGLEVCRALRTDPRTATSWIAMMSGRSVDEAVPPALRAGADVFFAKPLKLRQVRAWVDAVARAAQ